jgi:protein-L-isoaspartate(D-aspartate) O-methyltransferase
VGYFLNMAMTLDECRRFYAEEICLSANIRNAALIEAFARVPRENFLGPGPWKIVSVDMGLGGTKNILTDDADPRHVYHNLPIALDSARDLNNGQPAALAKWMDALGFKTGNRVFHLGCGVGYYSAIIAEVVGSGGSVVASEIDPDLAARAKANLKAYPNVEVHSGDGAKLNPGPCDAILINAGVTHPHAIWLDSLRENGRLLLPLTIPMGMGMGANLGKGVMVKIIREPGGFSARVVTFVGIYSCASVRDPQLEPLLGKALASGALLKIKSLRRDWHPVAETCVVHGNDLCFSTAPLAEDAPSP